MNQLATTALLLALAPLAAHAATPVPTVRAIPEEASPFDDRSAPSTYQYENGAPTNSWSFPGEILGVHRFESVGGADLITNVASAWRDVPNGTAARVFVWQDNGSGDFRQSRLVSEQGVTVANTGTGILNVYPLSSPAPVSGTFFVGFSILCDGIKSPLSVHEDSQYVSGRALICGVFTPPLDASNPASIPIVIDVGAQGLPGYFLLRASGSGSSFSCQGRLTDSGATYTGNADFKFTIYDSVTGGVAVSPQFAQSGVPVSQGVFSVLVPAQASTFAGAADRFLEVSVRAPSGSGSFTVISPRIRVASVPTALVATLAQSVPWSGITGIPTAVTAALSGTSPSSESMVQQVSDRSELERLRVESEENKARITALEAQISALSNLLHSTSRAQQQR
ncbi:MAG: DNA-binding protein [Phycisphaerales bacterium]